MSSQESDLYPDGGDDLVMAFLEQEAQTKQEPNVGSQMGTKRARTRSVSPDPDSVNPHAMGVKPDVKVDTEHTESRKKRRKVERSPSIEFLEIKPKDNVNDEEETRERRPMMVEREREPPSTSSYSSSSSSPIVILESPVAWPPGKMTAAEGIKQAHTAHRKYLATSSTSSSSCLPSASGSGSRLRTQIKQEQLQPHHHQSQQQYQYQHHHQDTPVVSIHPSLTGESSQTTLTPYMDEVDADMNPLKKARSKGKVKQEAEEKVVVTRDEKGNLTERARRALDKKLLESLGREENAITNSDLYSRTQHIISAASGHQVSNRGGAKYSISGKDYNTSRNQKLKQQFTAAVLKPEDGEESRGRSRADSGGNALKETFVVQSRIFDGLTMWLNGYSGNKITDMELKKLIAVHGGTISMSEGSRITHVLVSERISGTKAEKFLRGATKAYTKNGKKKVVLVDWVLNSVKQGKRLSESAYNVIENESQPTIVSKFGFSSASPSRKRSDVDTVKRITPVSSGKHVEIVNLDDCDE